MIAPDPGLITGAFGILCAVFCAFALRKQGLGVRTGQAALRSELESMMTAKQAECDARMASLGESLAVLERSARNADTAAIGGLTRSARSQAMQTLRSGVSPEQAACSLGIGRREMQLLAAVSRVFLMK
ncbi:MAG: hypothetical protein M3N93_11865 [Acidobacteriota bacterium]|nr:hypothetical protein [Acidobacteriota bacterium]